MNTAPLTNQITPLQQSQVASWGENLKNTISANNKLVAELEERLRKVTRAPGNQTPLPDEYLVLMAVADEIRDVVRCVDQSNQRLQSLLNRCEL